MKSIRGKGNCSASEKTLYHQVDLGGREEDEKSQPTARTFMSTEGFQVVCWLAEQGNPLPVIHQASREEKSLVSMQLWESGGERQVPYLGQLGQPGETE